jgi:2-oxoglutarate ferredoxin oxidoreductase subunit beta
MNSEHKDLHALLDTADTPLNKLTEKELCPGAEILDDINESFR